MPFIAPTSKIIKPHLRSFGQAETLSGGKEQSYPSFKKNQVVQMIALAAMEF